MSRPSFWGSISFSDNIIETDSTITQFVSEMHNNGYSFLPQEFWYWPSFADFRQHLEEIKSTFAVLKVDPYSSGNRYRACSDYFFNSTTSSFDFYKVPLYQRAMFNAVDGGKHRHYDPIDEKLYRNPAFNALLNKDIDLVKRLGTVKFDESLLLEILQVRYSPDENGPSYSTPSWLHIDDEDITIVHLIHVDDTIIGGDTVIAEDIQGHNITDVIRLTKPFDTYMTNQSKFHAVTPMGTIGKKEANRYVFIISFRNVEEDEEVLKYKK